MYILSLSHTYWSVTPIGMLNLLTPPTHIQTTPNSPKDQTIMDSVKQSIALLRDGQMFLQVRVLLQLVVDPVTEGKFLLLREGMSCT